MQIIINENNIITSIIRAGYVKDAIEVTSNIPDYIIPYKYKWVNNSFVLNTDYVKNIAEDIEEIKLQRIKESKDKLAEYLENNPMQFTDGKLYSVTEEKQSLLNSNLSSYERATKSGIDYPLKWNSIGDECVSWTYENLVALSLSIAAYVAPKVSKQQEIETAIRDCETAEELESITISYD